MKVLYVELRKKFDLNSVNFEVLRSLPGKRVSLACSVQYLNLMSHVSKFLKSIGKKVIIKKGSYYDGQVLGCNSSAFDKNSDTLLLLADGKFHAINNALMLKKEIYVFNSYDLEKISIEEINKEIKKIETKKKIFLSSKNVGLIISTKKGQFKSNYLELKKKIEKLGKNVYLFESDTINLNELENFPNIDIWINTACFGIQRDSNKVINFSDIMELV